MSERKADGQPPTRRDPSPMGHHFESEVDRMIREAVERGEFDDLPGQGKPLPGAGQKDDDLWWVRRWVQRNRGGEEGS